MSKKKEMTLLATHFKTKKKAQEFARKQNEIYRKEFLILQDPKGFYVFSTCQLESQKR